MPKRAGLGTPLSGRLPRAPSLTDMGKIRKNGENVKKGGFQSPGFGAPPRAVLPDRLDRLTDFEGFVRCPIEYNQ